MPAPRTITSSRPAASCVSESPGVSSASALPALVISSGDLDAERRRRRSGRRIRPARAAPRPRARASARLSSATAGSSSRSASQARSRRRARGSPRSRRRARGNAPIARRAALIPAARGALAHEREEAAVVLVGPGARRRRPNRVSRRWTTVHLGQDSPERAVPLDGVVAARLPRVDQHGLAVPVRIASPSRKRCQAWSGSSERAGAPLVRMVVEQKPHAGGRQRRLGDAGDARGRRRPSASPTSAARVGSAPR